jgi:hypothetical protein
MTLPDEVLDDAADAAAEHTETATGKHTAEQRDHLATLAQEYDGRWNYSAVGGFEIRGEDFSVARGLDRSEHLHVRLEPGWVNGDIHVAVEHIGDGEDDYAGGGFDLDAETAEALAVDLLELAQEKREYREADDA